MSWVRHMESLPKWAKRRRWYRVARACGCHYCWRNAGFGRGPYDRATERKLAQSIIKDEGR